MNERELVRNAQAGDFEAFTELLNANKDRIYLLARKLTGTNEDAEDVVQDTFLKAIDKIGQFRLESSFGTWLYSIALNEARAHSEETVSLSNQPPVPSGAKWLEFQQLRRRNGYCRMFVLR